ncbi:MULTISPECIES: MerR family transcriptional regulator [Streptomyces]|uniref:MerR family transcriptional regulator n=1 Tax=Streptomyces TaxID=1883 RepID=UPI0004BDE995|nr:MULTISPECIES: MerR family transcriptional regulator [Streptomyces]KOU00105.1 transcriptional regulator [Streptomyces sp. NRRL F-4711]KOX38043.1 transcriptional regulator [Streptomyces sp. NRRL F-4707]KOX51114.1 transcriptional regulator [Streptomyces sp. NRRL F-7442]MCL7367373.1 MerR family transcriptional regulator [Streptomyces ardesiacus]
MRLADLSKRSGVSTATIKYYLREGLLPPGRQVNATTAEYDEGHLRRLRLVRALIQVGKVPVATAREVLGHVDDESLGRTIRLGAALWALPQDAEPDEADPAVAAARTEVGRLLELLGWETAREMAPLSPVHRSLVVAVAALRRLDYPWDAELMAPYGALMMEVARRELDFMETHASDAEQVEMAVASAVLFQPVLRALHRLAQEEESARRYGIE